MARSIGVQLRSRSAVKAEESEGDRHRDHDLRPDVAHTPRDDEQCARRHGEDRDHDVAHHHEGEEYRRQPVAPMMFERPHERADEQRGERQRDRERVLAGERALQEHAHDALVVLNRRVLIAGKRDESDRHQRHEQRCRPPGTDAAAHPVEREREADGTERGDELERDVVRHDDAECNDHQRRDREVELPGGETSVVVHRPAEELALWQQHVTQVRGAPHVGPHVSTVGRRIPEDEIRMHQPKDARATREHEQDRQPLDPLRAALGAREAKGFVAVFVAWRMRRRFHH
jgi:hypothetical protein